jgi:transcriptional regulator with XRE-family HTH domain
MRLKQVIAMNCALERKKLGLSQEQLAKRLAVTKQTVWRIEAAATNLSIESLESLAKVFRVQPALLLTDASAATEAAADAQRLEDVLGGLTLVREAIEGIRHALDALRSWDVSGGKG